MNMFPNQLPFFIKLDRLGDVTFHCPESAKIYADRVVENVPILAERVECLAMPVEPSSESKEVSGKPEGEDDEYEPSIADPNAPPGDPEEILKLLEECQDEKPEKGDAVMKRGEEAVEEPDDGLITC